MINTTTETTEFSCSIFIDWGKPMLTIFGWEKGDRLGIVLSILIIKSAYDFTQVIPPTQLTFLL